MVIVGTHTMHKSTVHVYRHALYFSSGTALQSDRAIFQYIEPTNQGGEGLQALTPFLIPGLSSVVSNKKPSRVRCDAKIPISTLYGTTDTTAGPSSEIPGFFTTQASMMKHQTSSIKHHYKLETQACTRISNVALPRLRWHTARDT